MDNGATEMSHWHYQIMRHTADSGEDFLAIHEFFVGHDKKQGWTAKPVPLEADTLAEMRMTLINALRDLERHGVRDAKTGEVVQAGAFVQM
jgi:hypothetical protein